MILEDFPADAVMQAVAAENNLAETAFLVAQAGDYRIRWFTPSVEVPLCGHATLASAAVVMEKLEPQLVPYWAEKHGRSAFRAYQASPRGGEIICRLKGSRVELEGACVFYMEGMAEI